MEVLRLGLLCSWETLAVPGDILVITLWGRDAIGAWWAGVLLAPAAQGPAMHRLCTPSVVQQMSLVHQRQWAWGQCAGPRAPGGCGFALWHVIKQPGGCGHVTSPDPLKPGL